MKDSEPNNLKIYIFYDLFNYERWNEFVPQGFVCPTRWHNDLRYGSSWINNIITWLIKEHLLALLFYIWKLVSTLQCIAFDVRDKKRPWILGVAGKRFVTNSTKTMLCFFLWGSGRCGISWTDERLQQYKNVSRALTNNRTNNKTRQHRG